MSFILNIRKEKQMTQQEFSDFVGIERSIISRAENGKISVKTAKKIASTCNLDWKIFFDEKRVKNRLKKVLLRRQIERG